MSRPRIRPLEFLLVLALAYILMVATPALASLVVGLLIVYVLSRWSR